MVACGNALNALNNSKIDNVLIRYNYFNDHLWITYRKFMNSNVITQGVDAIALVDKEFANALSTLGAPAAKVNPHGFETFLSTIVSQQLSTKVATVIMQRVKVLLKNVTPERVMEVADQALRDAGLSWRKVEYAKGLAQAVLAGEFDIDGLDKLNDDEAITAITKLRGFGCWSAEIYLMFSLQRLDIFPADDLGLLVALGKLKGLPEKPTAKQARDMVKHWSPWRSVGALFLWEYYHKND